MTTQRKRRGNPGRTAAAGILLLAGWIAAVATAGEGDGFVELFNGKDLSGWITGPDNAWRVEGGILTVQRDFDGKEHNADYLWAENRYANFILSLEVKIPEVANSGIFLRTGDLSDPVYTGIEVQVANSHGKTSWGRGNCAGAIYDCVAPSANPIKPPGEWNHYLITCVDNEITVELNGVTVVEMDLDRWITPHLNPDGSPNKFGTALKDFARSGYLGLQDHGRPVWYRNIRVKRLPGRDAESRP